MNDLARYADAFAGIVPWSGNLPAGYVVDFLGTFTPKKFLEPWAPHPIFVDGAHLQMQLPKLQFCGDPGEDYWFETVNWVLAAREASGSFVMMTLGALHGYQAVACCRALQAVNPMPYTLVAVEAVPENAQRIPELMRENGIDADEQWILEVAVSDTNAPALFPVGAPGAGAQNCVITDSEESRAAYLKELAPKGRCQEALRNLLLRNSTGLRREVVAEKNLTAEIKLVSCMTLADLLRPFKRVDYIEADMQQSEIRAFPPFIGLLRRKVRRIHIATHGQRVHNDLHDLFASKGWNIVFSYAPNTTHMTPWGRLAVNDGILTVRNPDF